MKNYSHIHINVTTRFLTCNPNLGNIQGYIDEADQFYTNPNAWLKQNYPKDDLLPSHIICFEVLVPQISTDILSRLNYTINLVFLFNSTFFRYKRIKQYFHCNLPLTSRIGSYVFILENKDFEIEWTT